MQRSLLIKARQHYAEDEDYQFMLKIAAASPYWYAPLCIEIAYLCPMRLSEVLDMTDANELPAGLLIKRRKGSRDNITAWNEQLKAAWQSAVTTRNQIMTQHKLPHPFRPEDRYVFISERTGDRIQVSSLKTAIGRITVTTQKEADQLGIQLTRFTFHDLKRKGVSDTTGNKQDASGHRNASMLNIYDVRLKTVEPSSE